MCTLKVTKKPNVPTNILKNNIGINQQFEVYKTIT